MTKLTNQPTSEQHQIKKKTILQNSVIYNFGMDLQTESGLRI